MHEITCLPKLARPVFTHPEATCELFNAVDPRLGGRWRLSSVQPDFGGAACSPSFRVAEGAGQTLWAVAGSRSP